MINKDYCMSSYLSLRYINDININFEEKYKHKHFKPVEVDSQEAVKTIVEIDKHIQKVFDNCKGEKLGILLSGGMDSGILASYMKGADAYTFRWGENFQTEEIARAENYAKYYGLNLHYVDISWDLMNAHLELLMKNKGAPVHSIEPQIYLGAMRAKQVGFMYSAMENLK